MKINSAWAIAMCLVLTVGLEVAGGDESPATTASSAPTAPLDVAATQPNPPHVALPPPGFHKLTVGNRSAFCLPADDGWVREALSSVGPSTRPTTMPSDMVASIQQRRDALVQMMMQDLALTDRKDLDAMLDRILANLAKVQTASVNVYYMPVTRAKLAGFMRDGWSDPRFHYIRYANDVAFDPTVTFTLDQQADDLVDWLEIRDDDPPASRRQALINKIEDFETADLSWFSLISQSGTRNVLAEFIRKHVVEPLKFPTSLTWFGQGVTGVYAVKYSALLSGSSREAQIASLIRPDPRNPLRAQSLDLVNPLDPAEMRPQLVQVYNEAAVHRGVDIVNAWVVRGGDGVLAKTLPALRAHPPDTAIDLIKIIRDATGIDLTPNMRPDYNEPTQ
jgi:hypothetical protein